MTRVEPGKFDDEQWWRVSDNPNMERMKNEENLARSV
jgi:hypothetical protein